LQTECEDGAAGGDRYQLLSVTQVADGSRGNHTAGICTPKLFSGFGVEREELSFLGSTEHQIARGREHASLWHAVKLVLPLDFARRGLNRHNRSTSRIIAETHWDAAEKVRSGLIRRIAEIELAGKIPDREVKQFGRRAIGRRVPVRSAFGARGDHSTLTAWTLVRPENWPAFFIDALGPRLIH